MFIIEQTSYTLLFQHDKTQEHHFINCTNLVNTSITTKFFTDFFSQVHVTINFIIQMDQILLLW
jgi:hypothetical protein